MMAHTATLIVLAPLAGFLFVLVNGATMKERSVGAVATSAVGLSFLASVVTFFQMLHAVHRVVSVTLFDWISVGSLHVSANLYLDPLAITMCLFVTGISTLIHLYSTGYMHGEKDYRKFFLYLNLFVFSMLVLVLAGNLALTFVGWEGVGLASYLLIGFWFYKETAAVAAKIAQPGRQVVSFSGDGCFLMNGQEFATAVQHGANIVIVVVDNGMYGTIRMHQEREYPTRVHGTELKNPDFAAYARAFGGHGQCGCLANALTSGGDENGFALKSHGNGIG